MAIFEDNKLVRDALRAVLNGTEGFVCVGAFEDGRHWLQDIKRSDPHVILMDIEMPGINGIELTRLVLDEFASVKILIQTVFNDSSKIFNALCAGASGYILKNDPPYRYIEAIREVYNEGAPMSTTVARKVLNFFSNKNVLLITPDNTGSDLSQREKEILKMMVDGQNLKTIGETIFISYETVRTHVKHIYKKLHVACRNEAVMKAVQQGIA